MVLVTRLNWIGPTAAVSTGELPLLKASQPVINANEPSHTSFVVIFSPVILYTNTVAYQVTIILLLLFLRPPIQHIDRSTPIVTLCVPCSTTFLVLEPQWNPLVEWCSNDGR